jgi:hypothetical protein
MCSHIREEHMLKMFQNREQRKIFGHKTKDVRRNWGKVLKEKFLSLHLTKYLPQHRILERPQPMYLLQCERPIFTPIQNNRQNYNSVYLVFISRKRSGNSLRA